MGGKSRTGKRREVNFSDAVKLLSEQVDQKLMIGMQQSTQIMSSLKLRLEVLETLLTEKLGETEESLKERLILQVEKNQGFVETENPVRKGSIIRLKVKEEVVGKEVPNLPMQDSFMFVGHGQISPHVDELVIGMNVGETRDVVLPDPKDANVQRRITAMVVKVYRGEEVNETPAPQAEPAPEAAPSAN
jgi:hypothetical protein